MTAVDTLRAGYTTGTCAAAAAKASALCLHGEACRAVEVSLPNGETVTLAIECCERLSPTTARASVIKDAGDDPDVTDGMTVEVTIELGGEGVTFCAGDGVGVVTRPGLQLAVGEPAINPVPREMITQAIQHVLGDTGCRVIVSIPGGAEVAAKTFNPRLGIEGGLSILGTSGRVEPKSEEAWLRSLLPQIDVAQAAGHRTLYLVPGGFGETAAREQLGAADDAIIQISNFLGDMLRACTERQVEAVVLVGHIGKLTKVAAGIFNTHSRYGDARLETVAAVAAAEGAPASLIATLLTLPTCEAAIDVLHEAQMDRVWDVIADRIVMRAGAFAGIPVSCALVGYQRDIIGRSACLRKTDTHATARMLHVIGVGPGPAEWLTPVAWRHIRQAEVIVGGQRHLDQFAPPAAERIAIGADISEVMAAIRERRERKIVVLASGDPNCFGILASLRREFGDEEICVVPGISAMQMALARLHEFWDRVYFSSAHGRNIGHVVEAAWLHPRVLAFTDHRIPPQAVAQALLEGGMESKVVVLECLGYPEERITCGSAQEIAAGTFDPLSVIYLEWE